jgi:sulfur carrier protein
VNGSAVELPTGATVSELLSYLEIDPVLVAVEQNLEIVRKSDFEGRKLRSGDQIEIVQFVGGG